MAKINLYKAFRIPVLVLVLYLLIPYVSQEVVAISQATIGKESVKKISVEIEKNGHNQK